MSGRIPLSLLPAVLAAGFTFDASAETGHQEGEIDEIIVSVPFEVNQTETALPILIVSGEQLSEKVATSLGETLSDELGVSNASYGPGVGQPIIRGQTGNRVKVLQNSAGVTDVASMSPDHANGVEAILAERLEVIRGPSTLLYGSGAIGGVVNVIDGRVPDSPVEKPRVRLEHMHDSVNSQNNTVGQVTFGAGGIGAYFGGFMRDSGNVEIDGFAIDEAALERLEELHGEHHDEEEEHDEEELENTNGFIGNSDTDASGGVAGISFAGDWGFIGVSVSELDNNYGLPPGAHGHHEEEGHDEDEEDHDEDDHDEDDHDEDEEGHGEGGHGEEVEFVRLDLKKSRRDIQGAFRPGGEFVQDIKFSVGWTDYEHGEIEYFEDGDSHVGTLFSHEGLEGRATMHVNFSDTWEGVIGTQFGDTEFSAVGEEAFIQRSELESTGVFGVARYSGERSTAEFGLRAERNRIDGDAGCSSSETSYSFGASTLFAVNEADSLYASIARSERAPTVEELYSNVSEAGCGIPDDDHDLVLHAATNLVEVGAPGLNTEQSNNVELAWRRQGDGYRAEVNFYLNRVSDYIFLDIRGEDEDERELAFWSARDATFRGWEAKIEASLAEFDGSTLALTAFADSVRAKFTSGSGGNIPRLAPGKLGGGMRLYSDDWGLHLHLTRVMDQQNNGPEELETDGYTRLSLYADRHWAVGGGELTVFLQGRNLLDDEIRNHASLLRNFSPDPGRNVRLGVRFRY